MKINPNTISFTLLLIWHIQVGSFHISPYHACAVELASREPVSPSARQT